jgi:hypothetical protein
MGGQCKKRYPILGSKWADGIQRSRNTKIGVKTKERILFYSRTERQKKTKTKRERKMQRRKCRTKRRKQPKEQ